MALRLGPCYMTLREGSRLSRSRAWGSFSTSPTWNTGSTTGCEGRSTVLWVHRNLFWKLSRDGNLHGSGMSHPTTASPKLSFSAPWRVGDTVVGRGNVGCTTSKSGHLYPCKECSRWHPAEKTGRGSLLNRSSCHPDDPIGLGVLNWPNGLFASKAHNNNSVRAINVIMQWFFFLWNQSLWPCRIISPVESTKLADLRKSPATPLLRKKGIIYLLS